MNTLVRVTALAVTAAAALFVAQPSPSWWWPQEIVVANCCLKFQPIPLFRRGICFCRCELDGVS